MYCILFDLHSNNFKNAGRYYAPLLPSVATVMTSLSFQNKTHVIFEKKRFF